jgi:signal transduction histidine kinase
MKLKDVKTGTQLRLGLGLILTFVVGLGVLAWRDSELIWLQTKTMYDHPLQVSMGVGELEADILAMHGGMEHLVLAQNDLEMARALQEIETRKANVSRRFDVLFDRYLGPRSDLTTLQDEFVKWNIGREETIRLLRAGKSAEATARIVRGADYVQVGVLIERIHRVEGFARNKAAQLFQAATEQNAATIRQLAVVVAGILLLSLLIAWLLLTGIKTPLAELTAATEQFRQGKLEVRSRYVSANEFGALSASFNTMAETIQTEMQIEDNAAQLASVMLREEDVHAFCRELLKSLLAHTGSQVGAVYFLNDAKTAFEHFESIGLGAGRRAAFSTAELEGELGAALATRQIQRISDIPAETRFAFAAVSGDFAPQEILTIPVLSDRLVSAVISLASVRAYDALSVRLVNDIWSVLTARLNGVLAFRKTKDLAERLELQNRELETQKRELTRQADELAEQNTELELQKRQLDEANRLKSVFLSNMSHELRTPLNSVIALAGVLNRRLANRIPAEEHGYLEVIERNGKNLLVMINDILDLSRIEAGREELNVSRFSVRDLADEMVALFEPQTLEKQIAVLNQVSGDLPPIASDLGKCRHILQNLVGNAVKFTEQGQVTIAARQTGDEMHVAVTDTGIGIAAGQLPFIFDEFRQADDSASRKYGGTGLGLAIAKKYALLLGGGITVQSVPGQGSTFTLRLPLALELPGAAPTAETERPSPCILLAEDSILLANRKRM